VAEAWAGAAKELARWAKEPRKVELVDLRQAWQAYAPVSLVAATHAPVPSAVDAQELGAAVDATLASLAAARTSGLGRALATVDAALAKRPTDGQLLLRKGHLLALTGDGEGARKALQAATKSSKWAAVAFNNLGNLDLAAGQTAQARGGYRKALDKGGAKDPRILVNAALAAYAAGDEDAFAEHVFSCLELGAEDLVLGLGQAGVKVDDGTRGADDAGLASRDLRRALQRAYERKRRAVPSALGGGEVRASQAGAARPSLGSLLYWL
jgi:tetratricopeptide (TPR) repeat protein